MFAYYLFLCLQSLFFSALHPSQGGFPKPLSAKDEAFYIERMKNGDEEAQAVLIEHNLRLVAHIVKRYHNPAFEQDDLISIGTIGLIKGIRSFNPDKNIKLATYISRCIENEILMAFRSSKKSSNDLYISDPIDFDSEGNALTLLDIIACEDTISDEIDIKIKAEGLKKHFGTALTPREQLIIAQRYGICGFEEMTQCDIARQMGISRSYVSRLEKKALSKLKDVFESPRK